MTAAAAAMSLASGEPPINFAAHQFRAGNMAGARDDHGFGGPDLLGGSGAHALQNQLDPERHAEYENSQEKIAPEGRAARRTSSWVLSHNPCFS